MGQVSLHPWYLVTCVLGAVNFYIGASANVAFPPGLAPRIHTNNSLTQRMRLEIYKQTILKALANSRRADVEAHTVNETDPRPPEPTGGPIFRPNFIYSESPGKNLLLFTINRNSTAMLEGQVTRVNLWVHIWLKEKKKKKQMRRRKSKIIRINVYKNNSSNSEDFVATLQTRIQSTHWLRIGLPVTLVQELKASKNNTITLRVECKRCNRRTRLMLPTKSKNKCKKNRRKRKKKRRNNRKRPNRKLKALRNTKRGCGTARSYPSSKASSKPRFPFMVIEQRYNSSDRRKRSVTCNPADLTYRNGTVNSRRCCRMSTYVDFSDIDLDDYIVTPGGYQASSCVGRCPRSRRNRNRNRRRNRSRDRNRNKRAGDRKRRGKCRAVQTSPLTVWLFDSEHNLVQAELQDLVVRNCDCR